MEQVHLYTMRNCSYCEAAKKLLEKEKIPFTLQDLTDKPDEIQALKEKTGHRTMPQIFVGDGFIGGYTELAALVAKGHFR